MPNLNTVTNNEELLVNFIKRLEIFTIFADFEANFFFMLQGSVVSPPALHIWCVIFHVRQDLQDGRRRAGADPSKQDGSNGSSGNQRTVRLHFWELVITQFSPQKMSKKN